MSDSQQNYIDLKVNGRLFPIWIMHNFKKYKLPPIKYDGDDPCKIKDKTQVKQLRDYQKFLTSYLDYRSPYKDILIYHGLGSGKTVTAINIYNILYNYTPAWNVFILIKASLKDDPWLKDLNNWLPKRDASDRMQNISFIHYDAPNADRAFLNAVKSADANKKNIYIVDEAHNFIKNVYSNIVSGIGKKAHTIYDYIITDKKENESSRVILLTGTPAVNNPYELALIFNLLRPDTFPKKETVFNNIYISRSGDLISLNPDTKNMFQRRIMGLVSYYIGSDPAMFASKNIRMKYLTMSKYQKEVYQHYAFIEEAAEKKRASTGGSQTLYKTYTRQASNFVFPVMGGEFSGENRPRPNKFNLSIQDAEIVSSGRMKKLLQTEEDIKKRKDNLELYVNAMNQYIKRTKEYFDKINQDDIRKGYTILDDINVFKKDYSMKFSKFWSEYDKKSKLLTELYNCSCKMTAIPFYIMRSKGPVIVFSNYVKMEGLEIFKIFLSYFGYSDYVENQNKLSFVEFHGEIDKLQRTKNLKLFNQKDNLDGSIIKIIMISPAGSEGINLRNVRQVHILDPYWNEVRLTQLMGRAIRMCSHEDLPLDERKVDIFRYHAIYPDKETTDVEIMKLAKEKDMLIDSFLKTIREVAVDCELFKNHNMINESYECFKFDEKAIFDKYVGPAYKEDIEYDQRINNGLNNKNSIKKKIKVIKINAVIKENGDISSDVKPYWYNPDTGIVYDYDMDYPIGRILQDNGIPNKLDQDTYIIEDVIPIPTLSRV